MGQWRIVETDIPSVTIGMSVVGASTDRAAVFICNLDTAALEISTLPPTGGTQHGIPIKPSESLSLHYNRDGGLARSEMRAQQCSGSGIVHITEVLYYPTES